MVKLIEHMVEARIILKLLISVMLLLTLPFFILIIILILFPFSPIIKTVVLIATPILYFYALIKTWCSSDPRTLLKRFETITPYFYSTIAYAVSFYPLALAFFKITGVSGEPLDTIGPFLVFYLPIWMLISNVFAVYMIRSRHLKESLKLIVWNLLFPLISGLASLLMIYRIIL